MSLAATMIADLRARGVTLEPRGDRLIARPVSRLSPDEVEALRRHKVEILGLLQPPPAVPTVPTCGDQREPQALSDIPVDGPGVRDALGPHPSREAYTQLAAEVQWGHRGVSRRRADGTPRERSAPGPGPAAVRLPQPRRRRPADPELTQ